MRVLLISTILFSISSCCQLKDFLPCVVQLNTQKVGFDVNPLNVIFNITSEAKLMHTCKTFGRVFPCFDQRISMCGTPLQKSQLDRGKRLHTYLCAPFSLQRQKIFLKHSQCIQTIIKNEQMGDCDKTGTIYQEKLQSCRKMCPSGPCQARVELSEVAACTILKIENHCSKEAADFFAQMQQVLTNREYPVQCQYDVQPSPVLLKKGLPSESIKPETPVVPDASSTLITVYPSKPDNAPDVIDGIYTRTSIPIMRRTDPNSKANQRTRIGVTPTLPVIKTVIVDTKNMRSPPRNDVVQKFLPNPYTTTTIVPTIATTAAKTVRTPILMKEQVAIKDQVRTTRTIPATLSTRKYTPWSFKNAEKNTLTPPTLAQNGITKITESVISSPPVAFNLNLPPDATSQQPFKVEINWMDDATIEDEGKFVSPWYIRSTPFLRPPEEFVFTTPRTLTSINPLLSQLQSQSLNFTEIGQQANNYFSAALNAFTDSKNEMTQNDPWRKLIDAVAPTIQKVSPDIIPRIREEINRIQPN
ncbi:unnamed protein product [Caenorhabditis bovis]|uniref:Uncharacterized protein n=1 Tax=Caenorhabditis bovis TaxID=2654633 RepID=A0A8S1EFF7_9PELO|nr:unnamed protein product [Caenorhabditis bovis]